MCMWFYCNIFPKTLTYVRVIFLGRRATSAKTVYLKKYANKSRSLCYAFARFRLSWQQWITCYSTNLPPSSSSPLVHEPPPLPATYWALERSLWAYTHTFNACACVRFRKKANDECSITIDKISACLSILYSLPSRDLQVFSPRSLRIFVLFLSLSVTRNKNANSLYVCIQLETFAFKALWRS